VTLQQLNDTLKDAPEEWRKGFGAAVNICEGTKRAFYEFQVELIRREETREQPTA